MCGNTGTAPQVSARGGGGAGIHDGKKEPGEGAVACTSVAVQCSSTWRGAANITLTHTVH
jgi:hypothetical protein